MFSILTEENPGFRPSVTQSTWSAISCLLWAPFYDNNSFVKQKGNNPIHTFTYDGQLPLEYNKYYWVGNFAGYKNDTVPGKHFFSYLYIILVKLVKTRRKCLIQISIENQIAQSAN